MIYKSIRFRLTLWYSAAFSLSLAAILTSVYFVTKQTLFSQTDSTITSHCNQIIQVFRDSSGRMITFPPKQIFLREFSEMPGMLLVVTDSGGRVVMSSQPDDTQNPEVTDLIEKSTQIIKPTFVERQVGTTNLRLGVFPVKNDESSVGLVIVGHPIDVILASLNRLITILIAIYLGFMALEVVGLYLLSRSALAPVKDLSLKIKRISSENLSDRLNVPKTGDEVEELIHSFNSLLERLNFAFLRERQFIDDVAHELKTPLSVIKSNSEVALGKARDLKEYQRILQETVLDINSLSSTINDILDLSLSEATPPGTALETVNYSDLLVELSEVASKLAGAKEINVSVNVEGNLNISGKRDKLFRALLNILENAVKYTPAGGTVSMKLERQGNSGVCEICDSGIGIEEKDLPHVFERFYRGSAGSEIQGTGLGLAIAKAIINQHGGALTVASKKGKGTTVTIKIPLSKSQPVK